MTLKFCSNYIRMHSILCCFQGVHLTVILVENSIFTSLLFNVSHSPLYSSEIRRDVWCKKTEMMEILTTIGRKKMLMFLTVVSFSL